MLLNLVDPLHSRTVHEDPAVLTCIMKEPGQIDF
jgi:hypothetical protein